jgi:hypothetical protein
MTANHGLRLVSAFDQSHFQASRFRCRSWHACQRFLKSGPPAPWCNGSTNDSESFSRGSNPRGAISIGRPAMRQLVMRQWASTGLSGRSAFSAWDSMPWRQPDECRGRSKVEHPLNGQGWRRINARGVIRTGGNSAETSVDRLSRSHQLV